jgi:hypothetical protein
MQARTVLLLAATVGCSSGLTPPPTPAAIAAMPDSIPCDKAVKVDAWGDRAMISAERRWLDGFYPKHGEYMQSLRGGGGRRYDVLYFRRANGHPAWVCFDITGASHAP